MENESVGKVEAVPDEQAAYEELYRAHYVRVMGLCRLLLADPHEAEDVAQEVFLKLFQAQQRQGQPMAWGPWLTRVSINACHDRRRSGWWKWWRANHQRSAEADRSPHGLLPEEEASRWGESQGEAQGVDASTHGRTPEEEALSREERGRIWRSFRQLTLRQQEVFVMRHLEGWSTDQVGKALGLSAGSVKRHLFRAVHHLRTAVGDRA